MLCCACTRVCSVAIHTCMRTCSLLPSTQHQPVLQAQYFCSCAYPTCKITEGWNPVCNAGYYDFTTATLLKTRKLIVNYFASGMHQCVLCIPEYWSLCDRRAALWIYSMWAYVYESVLMRLCVLTRISGHVWLLCAHIHVWYRHAKLTQSKMYIFQGLPGRQGPGGRNGAPGSSGPMGPQGIQGPRGKTLQ
jgi:hypothetical protein